MPKAKGKGEEDVSTKEEDKGEDDVLPKAKVKGEEDVSAKEEDKGVDKGKKVIRRQKVGEILILVVFR